MASFSQLAKIAAAGDFQQRVSYALVVAAVNVYGEDPLTVGHATRKAYALKVISDQVSMPLICLTVLSNSSIAAEANNDGDPTMHIPDGDIQFAINSVWNLLSGV